VRDTQFMAPYAVLLLGFVTLVVVRRLAAQRLGMHRARYAWLYFAPTFVFPVATMWLAVMLVGTMPAVALLIGIVGLGYGLLLARMVRGIARASVSAASPVDLANMTSEPMTEFVLVTTTLGLAGVLVLGIALILGAITGGGR
jgi:hypothetical protein